MVARYLRDFEQRYVWGADIRDAPAWKRVGLSVLRTIVLIARDLTEGDLNLRAMSLVYTTLLSLVPLLALSFSILKGFGVQNRLDDTLRAALEPLGDEKSLQLTQNIIDFVNNMNVGVLGAMGLVFLVYTVVSLMQKIERAFNSAWRIRTGRTFGERVATFLSAITIGPLLIFSAIAITGSAMNTTVMTYLQSVPVIGDTIDLVARFVPFALVITAFTFLYSFIPNTKVRFVAALTGGFVSGIMWELLGFGFASFAADATRYHAIYATFASAILFLIWLYLNWLILLVGATIAFYRQHPEVVATGLREVHFNRAMMLRYVFSLLARIGQRFYGEQEPYTLKEIAAEFRVPGHALQQVLGLLVDVGILAETDDGEPRYVPRVPFDTTKVARVLDLIDVHQPRDTYAPPLGEEARIAALEREVTEARARALTGLTLKELAVGQGALGKTREVLQPVRDTVT